jgi:hemerythrin-like domain-containing protein
MTPPTAILRDEHVIILRALDALETAVGRLEAGHGPPDAWWDDVLHWLRTFADRSHHGKEEDLLFPAMIRAGVPSGGGPIDVMLEEHERGRALVRAMAATSGADRAAAARDYVVLLRAHIDKENEVLFPLADAILTDDEQRVLDAGFTAVTLAVRPEGALDHAERVLEALRVEVAAPRLVRAS